MLNETTIEFTTEFKEIIKELQSHNDVLKMKNCSDREILNECQINIRNYILEKYPKLLSPQHYQKMPDYYAVFVCIVLQIDDYNNWSDISNNFVEKSSSIKYEDSMNYKYKCSCGHEVCGESSYIVGHPDTDIHLLLGCDCICKTKIIKKFDEIKKERKAIVRKHKLEVKQKEMERIRFIVIESERLKNEAIESERLESVRLENEELAVMRAKRDAQNKKAKELHILNNPFQCPYCDKHIKKTYGENTCWECYVKLHDKCECGKYKKMCFLTCFKCKLLKG